MYQVPRTFFTLLLLCLICYVPVQAQFNISEPFRTSDINELIILGGFDENLGSIGAILTAAEGIDDPNDGWLRLTNDETKQRGYAYIDESFPSSLGVQVELEYKMYRTKDTDRGADGFTIFLFDGEVGSSENPFQIGGYGGDLGYKAENESGLKGGYLGIGFDVYGNFSDESEQQNKVVIRGPESESYKQLAITTDRIALDAGMTSARPSDQEFYRKVQVRVEPTEDGRFNIWVGWKTSPSQDNYVTLIETTIDEEPFETLKVGFAASTGDSVNFHEIRDMVATTPGNLRVVSRASQEEVVLSVDNADERNSFQFAIEVHNETRADLYQIQLKHALTDLEGLLEDGSFELTDIQASGFLDYSFPTLEEIKVNPELTGILALEAEKTGTVLLSGKLLKPLWGERLISEATVSSQEIEDIDPTNNHSTVSSLVKVEGVDLSVQLSTVNESCSIYALSVKNIGSAGAGYVFNKGNNVAEKIILEIDLPAGVSITEQGDFDAEWHPHGVDNNNVYRYTKKYEGSGSSTTLNPGEVLEDLQFLLEPSEEPVDITVRVIYDHSGYPEVTKGNNELSFIIVKQTPPIVEGESGMVDLYYFEGEEVREPLQAQPVHGSTINWYDDNGDIIAPPIPDTQIPGLTTFSVSQTNGLCESSSTTVRVHVLPLPSPGALVVEEEICKGNKPLISSLEDGEASEYTIKTYKWEKSLDSGQTWTIVDETSEPFYQVQESIYEPVQFQRSTISTIGEKSRTSEPTGIKFIPKDCYIMVNPALPSHAYPQ